MRLKRLVAQHIPAPLTWRALTMVT